MYSFTNQFSGPTLHQRVGMMNSQGSGPLAWWRYGVWIVLMGTMALACRHRQTKGEKAMFKRPEFPFLLTNATRVLASELDKEGNPWFRLSVLSESDNYTDTIHFQNRVIVRFSTMSQYPTILYLHNNHLALKLPNVNQGKVFINGQASSAASLSALTFEQVDDLFVYKKMEDVPGADQFPELYRVFISTTHKTPKTNPIRLKWKQYLLANAVSDHPLGHSSTFSMNKLLEATFFSNKLAFVKRTKDDYLTLYDEYATDIDLYINGLPADKKDVEHIHVREVDRLYTRERSFEEWTNEPNRAHRFVLYIQTAPKRAKRDSSYYVFSPFYSGDF